GFPHIPSSVFLIVAAFSPNLYLALGLLLLRSALSQMDVPTRTSYVMAVVKPAERPAAARVHVTACGDAARPPGGRQRHRGAAQPRLGHQPGHFRGAADDNVLRPAA